MINLSPEEQEILDSVESNEWKSVPNVNQEIQRYQSYLQNTTVLTEEIKVHVDTDVLNILKDQANRSGISLQVLISHALQQYATGQLESQS
ncbi:MAG: antitoxin [Halothece sp.]